MAISITDQENKSAQTRQMLLDSAIMLFTKYGVKKVTIDDICNNCNLTKGSFYYHFPTKDHIVTLSINSGLDIYIKNNYSINNSLNLSQQITNLNVCAFKYFKSIGKEMARASYVSMINSSVEVRIQGRVYVDYLTYIITKANEANAFLTNFTFKEAYMHSISVFTGIIMKWSTSIDASYDDINWENLIKEQFKIMFK
ncbi:TetR/AcrR family transcriptional regulator [Sedimentibacter sp. MB31-C6]|uniref:TetR/AcrR family transcriptional regulator n=1 Tax=Sedimentibacter sp. MB31-C6 TaxID=3109366 RepID=UPI002DDCA8AB|nr:TetR/AcrR family transcriptional regulator [Sedimentibacter sp. MB36-C1]WSI03631.1 TetR/AcrR family transcriptional regulator [Sedimentibacter sp. MB36-C1]